MNHVPRYGPDLALVHSVGFSLAARASARLMVGRLRSAGLLDGCVVELGCGSGESASILDRAGFAVVGLDRSADMLRLARVRVPGATLERRSLWTATLPAAVGVTAVGEPLSYLPAPVPYIPALAKLFRRIHGALVPGGLLLLDVVTPDRVPRAPARTWTEGRDWAVLVEATGDRRRGVVTRRIVTFVRAGGGWRRSVEWHRQRAVPATTVVRLLIGCGFSVERLDAYGTEPLLPGQAGFLAVRLPRPRRRARPWPRR
jgi:SAM-dependent methyltransferase